MSLIHLEQPSITHLWIEFPWVDVAPWRMHREFGEHHIPRPRDAIYLRQCMAKMRLLDTFYRSTDPEREETKRLIEAALEAATQPTGRKD